MPVSTIYRAPSIIVLVPVIILTVLLVSFKTPPAAFFNNPIIPMIILLFIVVMFALILIAFRKLKSIAQIWHRMSLDALLTLGCVLVYLIKHLTIRGIKMCNDNNKDVEHTGFVDVETLHDREMDLVDEIEPFEVKHDSEWEIAALKIDLAYALAELKEVVSNETLMKDDFESYLGEVKRVGRDLSKKAQVLSSYALSLGREKHGQE